MPIRSESQVISSTRATSVEEERMVNPPPAPTSVPAALATTASPAASNDSNSAMSRTTEGYPLAASASTKAPNTRALDASISPRRPRSARSPSKLAATPKRARGASSGVTPWLFTRPRGLGPTGRFEAQLGPASGSGRKVA